MSTFWKVMIGVIIAAVVAGSGGWYFGNYVSDKKIKAKDDEIASLGKTLGVANDKIRSLSSQTSATTTTPTTSTTTTSWKNYTNSKFGFSLTFNDLWKNFELVEKSGSDTGAISYLYVCIPTVDSTFSSEKSGMYCPFVITVVSIDNKAAFDAAEDPQKPTFVASNSKYAYYSSMSQAAPTDGMSARNDVKNIVATFETN
jgi:hypothetical protein